MYPKSEQNRMTHFATVSESPITARNRLGLVMATVDVSA